MDIRQFLVQAPAPSWLSCETTAWVLRALSSWVLNTSENRASRASLNNPMQHLVVLRAKMLFLLSILNLLFQLMVIHLRCLCISICQHICTGSGSKPNFHGSTLEKLSLVWQSIVISDSYKGPQQTRKNLDDFPQSHQFSA